MSLEKSQGLCVCSKPTKKMEGRNRWLKTCGEDTCKRAVHLKTLSITDENGLTGFWRRGRNIAKGLTSECIAVRTERAKAKLSSLGEDGLTGYERRGNAISLAKGGSNELELRRYRRMVPHYTKKQDLSDLKGFDLLKSGHQIDHILSVVDGFKLKLSPKQVPHKANLQVLSRQDNRAKWPRSDQTAEQLLEKINDHSTLPFR